jgi:hypothetical protein
MLPDMDIEALRTTVKDALNLAGTGRAPAGPLLLLAGCRQAEQSAGTGEVDRASLVHLWRLVYLYYGRLYDEKPS